MKTFNTRRSLIALAVTTGALLAGNAHAQDPGVTVYNDGPAAAAAVSSYWTAERLAKAQPMPLGVVKAPDATASSYGTSVLDFTRSRITPQSANTAAPYRYAGKLFFTIPGQGNFQCSASVVRNRLIVTAAHCMYSAGIGFHTNWIYIPGYDGAQSTVAKQEPYCRWSWSYGIVPTNWISTSGSLPNKTDFGLLEMTDRSCNGFTAATRISSVTGRFTVATNHAGNTHVTMLGYPGNFDSGLIMQRNDSSDRRTTSVANAVEYGSDMTQGSSGGPWVENFGTGAAPTGSYATRNAVVAVTSYIYNDPAIKILGASGFNSDFSSILSSACANKPDNC